MSRKPQAATVVIAVVHVKTIIIRLWLFSFHHGQTKLLDYWLDNKLQRSFTFYPNNISHAFLDYTYLLFSVKFGYSEKATKFEKIFHIKFDITE